MSHPIKFTLRIATILIGLSTTSACAGTPLIEFDLPQQSIQGKTVAFNKHRAWLVEPNGVLHDVTLSQVKGFRKVADQFRGYSSSKMRDDLLREFGRDYEVAGKGSYLVCAARGKANAYAEQFDQLHRSFKIYFSTRGFRVKSPEFPMVAIVFPNHREFAAYAAKDGVRAGRGLMGYYMPRTNRVALFDPAGEVASTQSSPVVLSALDGNPTKLETHFGNLSFPSISADLQSTMIHEATHQVAFNLGLHTRVGENPRWVVEGLAMVFETPANRANSRRGSAFSRANRERYLWFRQYSQARRQSDSLANFVSRDALFQTGTLDAYAEAWALSFFLLETRSSDYSRYLKQIAKRDPLVEYTAAQRLEDFQAAFGKDTKQLEAQYVRFIDRLE